MLVEGEGREGGTGGALDVIQEGFGEAAHDHGGEQHQQQRGGDEGAAVPVQGRRPVRVEVPVDQRRAHRAPHQPAPPAAARTAAIARRHRHLAFPHMLCCRKATLLYDVADSRNSSDFI